MLKSNLKELQEEIEKKEQVLNKFNSKKQEMKVRIKQIMDDKEDRSKKFALFDFKDCEEFQ
jgi:hypothetical protein